MTIFNQWLRELGQELQDISEDDRSDILDSYEEQINEMIEANMDEEELLFKLGSPKKVAQEVRESLNYTCESLEFKESSSEVRQSSKDESPKSKDLLSEVRRKSNGDMMKQMMKVCLLLLSLFVVLSLLMISIRLIIGGIFLSSVSIGLVVAMISLAVLFLNAAVTLIYIGYVGYKRLNGQLVKKER